MAKTQPRRQGRGEASPAPQSQATVSDPTLEMLGHMSRQLERIAQTQERQSDEIKELKEGQKELAQTQKEQAQALTDMARTQEESAVRNAEDHGDMRAGLAGLQSTVAFLVDERRTKNQAGAQAAKPEDPIARTSKLLEFGEKWVPRLIVWGTVIGGALAALYKAATAAKGGTPQP